ncbi:TPA: hypothetical protein N2743_004513 [Vibrio parahaemolyticus]|nr:hypothetical protein [Vibrio parahaemolyticus]
MAFLVLVKFSDYSGQIACRGSVLHTLIGRYVYNQNLRKFKVLFSIMNKEKAKKIIEKLHSDPKSWRRKEFKNAYFSLTGQKQVMSKEIAQEILTALADNEKRWESVEYVSAFLLLTGKWLLPKTIAPSGMSSQIKAKYSQGDLLTCSSPLAYKK